MSKFTRQQLRTKIAEVPIVPLFTHRDLDVAKDIVKTCYEGGIRVFEYTNRSVGADKVFEGLLAYARKEMPELAIGIGTIYTATEAENFISMGADFIIQPIVNEEVGEVCRRNNISWIPGAMTLTEIYQAQKWGADIVKIFPANIVGTAFIKAVQGPMPDACLMATGGIQPSKESLKEWFSSGAFCVGMGSQLFPKETLETKNYTNLLLMVRTCVELTKTINHNNL